MPRSEALSKIRVTQEGMNMAQSAPQGRPLADTAEWRHLHCSFCGRDGDHVRFLASGVFGGTTCDRCCLQASIIFLGAHLRSALRMTGIRRNEGAGADTHRE